jgi:hypothetical protein
MRTSVTRECCLTARVVCAAALLAANVAPQVTGTHRQDQPIKLDLSVCQAASAEQQGWLGPEWSLYLKFVKSCDVKQSKTVVLYVISVWDDEYYASLPETEPAVKFPKPILMSPAGKTLGRLPLDFPRDPPRTLDLTFARWSAGFPHEIRMWLEDPTVLGNRSLPSLEWDSQTNTYKNSRPKEGSKNGRSGC